MPSPCFLRRTKKRGRPDMKLKNKAIMCPIVFGIIMIIIGLCIRIPGGVLTTYSSLDGEKTEGSYYSFDDTYSAIDEYVGGDAYNYEIGASLVAGKIAGAMISRSIFIVGGLMCICLGITLLLFQKKENISMNEMRAEVGNDNTVSSNTPSDQVVDDNTTNVQNVDVE